MAKREPKPKNKEIDLELIEKEEKQPEIVEKEVQSVENEPIEEENDALDDLKLPNKNLFRVNEVAEYFDVTERTVYLWIDHGHLKTEQTPGGQWRVTRESLDKCRFAKKKTELDDDDS